MNRIEPGWDITETRLREDANGHPIDLILPIALGSRLRKSWGELRAGSFESRGTAQLSADALTIRTSVSRLLSTALYTDLTLRLEDVYNVRVNKKLVQFDLVNGPGELEPIILRADNREDAALLATALPQQTTRTYATDRRAEALFLERLMARTPHLWATWTIVTITTLVFIVMVAHGAGLLRVHSAAAIAAGSNFGPYTQRGQWWRLLTSVFIHFGLSHIFFNMLVLVQSGRLAERFYGSARFIAIYLFAGITASQVSLLVHPGLNSAGASGAIFGVIGAVLAYLICHRGVVPRGLYVRHFRLTAWFTVYALLSGLTHVGVDNAAHAGGLMGGFIVGLLLAPPLDNPASRSNAITTAGLAAIACAFSVCMTWMLAALSSFPDRQEAIQFAQLQQTAADLERRALADLKTLPHDHLTPEVRLELSQKIRTTLLPEWKQLDAMEANARVTPDSPNERLRAKLQTYYDDMAQELDMMATMAEQNRLGDPASQAELKQLTDQTHRAHAALLRR